MVSTIITGALRGIEGELVTVETDLEPGLPNFFVVGLPDASVREARERIRSAVLNCGYDFPMKRITVNLSPADLPKEGTHFDLPIAVSLLAAAGVFSVPEGERWAFFGELSLKGELTGVRGALSLALALQKRGIRRVVLPMANLEEVSILSDMEFWPLLHLRELEAAMGNQTGRIRAQTSSEKGQWFFGRDVERKRSGSGSKICEDFGDVRGQEQAKRALTIAAAGGHSILMLGPPGAGKTMLARRLPGILPSMNEEEILEVTRIFSAAGELKDGRIVEQRPFRAPHHSASAASLAGGGTKPKPGEITLAHKGVLFLDEFPEFSRASLEVLRQPMEEKRIVVSRVRETVEFPADFLLVASCNPCPCGYYGDGTDRCRCSAAQVRQYLSKLSGPLMDRIDIHIRLEAVKWEQLRGEDTGEAWDEDSEAGPDSPVSGGNTGLIRPAPLNPSAPMPGSTEAMGAAVEQARQIQANRYRNTGNKSAVNAGLPASTVRSTCAMNREAEALLRSAFHRLHLSARSYQKVLKLARTIADLDGIETVGAAQIAEAVQYRCLDNPIS